MEEFKTVIKRRIGAFTAVVVFALAAGGYEIFSGRLEGTSDSAYANVEGFVLGLIFGLGIVALAGIIPMAKAIKNETELKVLYNKEHDERLKLIRFKSGAPVILVTSVLMIIAGIVASFYSFIIFATLTAAAAVQLLIACFLKFYFTKTM